MSEREEIRYNRRSLSKKDNFEDFLHKRMYQSKLPHFPHYSSFEDRLHSFTEWPKSIKIKPHALSEAGFFYSGIGDQTICFHCGGGLNEWKEYDNPWIEHSRWFSKCWYVLNVKGEDVSRENCDIISLNEKIDTIADAPKKIISFREGNATDGSENIDITQTEKTIPKKSSESSLLCKICFSEEMNTLFIPCKHLMACGKCSSHLSKCAICRQPILDTIKIYHS